MPHNRHRRRHRPRHAIISKCHIFGQEVTTCWITTCIGISTIIIVACYFIISLSLRNDDLSLRILEKRNNHTTSGGTSIIPDGGGGAGSATAQANPIINFNPVHNVTIHNYDSGSGGSGGSGGGAGSATANPVIHVNNTNHFYPNITINNNIGNQFKNKPNNGETASSSGADLIITFFLVNLSIKLGSLGGV